MAVETRVLREALAVVEQAERSNQPTPPTKAHLLRENFIFWGAALGGAIGYLAGAVQPIRAALETGHMGRIIDASITSLGSTGPIGAVAGLALGIGAGYLAYRSYSFIRKIYSRG